MSGITQFCSSIVNRRFPLIALVSLTVWVPLLAFWSPFQSVTANGLLLNQYSQVWAVSTVTLFAIVFCVAILRIQNHRSKEEKKMFWNHLFGDGTKKWTAAHFLFVSMAAFVSPFFLAVVSTDEFSSSDFQSHLLCSLAATFGGTVSAITVLWILGKLKSYLFGNQEDRRWFFPFENLDKTGRFSNWNSKPWFIDFQLIFYILVLGITHFLLVTVFKDSLSRFLSVPLIVVMITWIGCLLFSGLANLLDSTRIPLTFIIILIAVTLQIFAPNPRVLKTARISLPKEPVETHFFAAIRDHEKREKAVSTEGSYQIAEKRQEQFDDDMKKAIRQRLKKVWNQDLRLEEFDNQTAGKTLVIVTCPGGGIHAAAWTAKVLEELSKNRDSFADSIFLISGVSGGSVGTYCFASSTYPDSKNSPQRISETAMSSSLEDIAFGLLSNDFYGYLFPGLNLDDRGQRLENSIKRRFRPGVANRTLKQWGNITINSGEAPILVFNATDAASGRRVLFDTVPTPIPFSQFGDAGRPINYRELITKENNSQHDINTASAVRASASFPYISPFVGIDHPSELGKGIAIGDGGYADNEGIVSAAIWIDFLLKQYRNDASDSEKAFDRILLLRITPHRSYDSGKSSPTDDLAAYMRWISGPIEAVGKVRAASQSERGNLEVTLLATEAIDWSTSASNNSANQESQASNQSTKLSPSKSIHIGSVKKSVVNSIQRSFKQFQRNQLVLGNVRKRASTHSTDNEMETAPTANLPKTLLSQKIIVKEVLFYRPGPKQEVPLNWKLSKNQKEWYQQSWNWTTRNDPELMSLINVLFPENSNKENSRMKPTIKLESSEN